MRSEITVRVADWNLEKDDLLAIRYEVFVHEQGVPIEEERDRHDDSCTHVLAVDRGQNVGTGRLLPTGKIGRMAVLASHRGRGIGSKLLRHLIELAQERGFKEVYLDAQLTALKFYETAGFVASGPVFKDAGIDHRRMTRSV